VSNAGGSSGSRSTGGAGGSNGNGWSTHRDVACASSRPRASSTRASESACRRPAWITVPVATSRSLDGPAGSRKLIESSELARPTAGGSVETTAPASAASATKANVPPGNGPAADRHQGLAGIDHRDDPSSAPSTTSPLRWVSGGAGRRRWAKSRSCSRPGNANSPGCSRYANDPRTGSSTTTRRGYPRRCRRPKETGCASSNEPGDGRAADRQLFARRARRDRRRDVDLRLRTDRER